MPSPRPMVQDGFEYREMTKEEFAQYQKDQAYALQAILDVESKIQEKKAILERLGLSVEELAILLS